ncbi:MAG: FAD-dependent oxidoreductase [Muribaculaceae bacterium]
MQRRLSLPIILICSLLIFGQNFLSAKTTTFDVIVIGGGASGVTAGVQAARMGVKTVIVEESPWLGGMLTSAGVSAIDGNNNLPGGLWGEFKHALEAHYGGAEALKTGWVSNVQFEPNVGEKILSGFTEKEKNLKVKRNTQLLSINKVKKDWVITVKGEKGEKEVLKAKVLIDATELGDVAKQCGVKYDVGMESRDDTKESIAPQKKNNIVQDITYVAVLKDYGKDVTIARPAGYEAKEFACACINDVCTNPKEPDRMWSLEKMITYGQLPNNRYMINWPIEGNDYYVNLIDMTPQERAEALKGAKDYTMKFVYFIQHELGLKNLGLADDIYPTADRLPFIPYHRESRRIHGAVRFTLNHIDKPFDQQDALYRTCIAVGDYPVDHHHTRYQGYEELPNLYFHPIPSYGLPLGTLIPQDVEGLIVAEKSISVSNIVNGTTRLQPVVLQIGQAAGALASLAVKGKTDIKNVKVRDVQNALLNSNGYLLPYLDVPVGDSKFKPYQRVGSTGILKGIGKNVEWSNQTWLRADTLLLANELQGLKDVYPAMTYTLSKDGNAMKISAALEIIENVAKSENINLKMPIAKMAESVWKLYNLGNFDSGKLIKRGEMALLIDTILDPFNKKSVTITGKIDK